MLVRGDAVKRLLCGLGCMLSACGHAGLGEGTDGGHKLPGSVVARVDAGHVGMDAGAVRGSPASNPPGSQPGLPGFSFAFPFDGGVFMPAFAPPSCPLQVGAECDGNEDCDHGRVCCGTFDQGRFTYTKIECASSCSGQDEFQLCHGNDGCGSGLVCRRSLILPFAFLSVCASPAEVPSTSTGRDRAGQIECGDSACAVGREKCCLTAHFDSSTPYPVAEPAYCAPLDGSCACGEAGGGEDAGR